MGLTEDRQWDALMAVAQDLARTLGPAFLQVIEQLRGRMTPEHLLALLTSGGPQAVADAVMNDPAVATGLREALRTVLVDAAIAAAGHLPPALAVAFTADTFNPFALQVIRQAGAALVQQVSATTVATIQHVTAEGIKAGQSPLDTARDLRDSLGLTVRQEQAVRNFRSFLENGDPQALQRALRDRRYDRTVQAMLDGKGALTPDRVDAMVDAYRRRYLIYRSQTIARSESIKALAAGNRMAWEQVFGNAGVTRAGVRRFWHVALGENTCEVCRPIPRLNPQGVGFDEPFKTPIGDLMDPTVHPDCRCVVFVKPS